LAENFFYLQTQKLFFEALQKFKANLFGSIFELRRQCSNTSLLQMYLPCIKRIEYSGAHDLRKEVIE